MGRFAFLLSAFIATLALSACTGGLEPQSLSSTHSFRTYTYNGVDALMSRAGGKITKSTPMLVGTIGNVNDVETSSTFGRAITEQISGHLAQKGYKVAELKLRQGIRIQESSLSPENTGEFLLSRDTSNISGEHKAAAAIAGTYAVGASRVLVNLRLLDIRSGNIITSYDYELPKTPDIMAMIAGGDSASDSPYFTSGWAY